MPREFPRSRRVGDQLQRELSELIRREIKDPRVGMVTITDVEVSRDLSHAKVFVSTFDREHDPDVMLTALKHAAGFLRRELGRVMTIRSVPELHFHFDRSIEEGARMDALIDAARAADRSHDHDDHD